MSRILMKLLLHIGTEKTGTTTTQHWAAGNRDALARQGVQYSRSLGANSHGKLYLCSLSPGRQDEGFRRLNLSSESSREEFRARVREEFAAEVAEARKSGCHAFLISNETCHSRLVTLEDVQRAREFLEPHFEEIEVLCGLRPQIDLAVSHTSNVAKGEGPITRAYFDKIGPDAPYYNYKTFVDRWSTAFGADRLRLVPIRRTPQFVDVIVARAGIDTANLEPPVRSNEALDVRVMAMTNAIKSEPLSGSRWAEPFAYIPREILHRLPCEQRLQPGLEIARAVQARFEDSNRELADSRADVEMADLEPDWERYSAPGNLDMLEQRCAFAQELGALVQLFNHNIAFERAKNEIADAERHLGMRRPVIARRCLNSAQRLLALVKKAEISSRRFGRLEVRAASLANELGADHGDSEEGRRLAKKPRRGRRRASADDESEASDALDSADQR
jgi:hypothetical protein